MSKVFFAFDDDIIDPCFDGAFKAIFTKNTPESQCALRGLLSGILSRAVEVTAVTANEPPVDDLHDRQIRYDINCRFDNGELANIEMTMYPDTFEAFRLEYYASKLQVSQNIKGRDKSYKDLCKSYQISFIAHEKIFPDDELVHEFFYYDPKTNTSLGKLSNIITVEFVKLEDGKSPEEMSFTEHWTAFFRYSPDPNKRALVNTILEQREEIAMAAQALIHISKDEVERARLNSEYKFAVDLQSKMVTAKREGRNEALTAVIREMLADKMSIDQISRFTRLTAEEVHRLLCDYNIPLQ